MVPYLSNFMVMQHLVSFWLGCQRAVDVSRERASLIGAPKGIVYQELRIEYLAIKGAAHYYQKYGKTGCNHTKTEHKAVLDSCHALEEEGWEVTWLDVDTEVLILPEQLKSSSVLIL